MDLAVDLRARRISASVTASAPEDRGGRARCTWLASQLGDDVDPRTVIEAYAKKAKTPTTATLAQIREDKDCLLGEDKRDPYRFKIVLSREMGIARKTGRKSEGFIDSVLALITDFYGTVVQNLRPWTPKAPKLSRSQPEPEPDAAPNRSEMQRVPPPIEDPDEDNAGPKLPAAKDGDSRSGDDEGQEEKPPAANDPWLRIQRFQQP